MPITRCLNCRRSLEPADRTHRFCPSCGALRVLPDPPGTSPDGAFVVLGYHVFGSQSGTHYGYESLEAPPRPVDALQGPGTPLPDLFAASEVPFPEAALHPQRGLPAEEGAGNREQDLGIALLDVACRHTRLFCLAEGGQISAYDTRTLVLPPSWRYPKLPGATASTRLQVGEALLYATTTRQGTRTLFAYEPGTGALRLEQSLPDREAQVLVAGGEVLVLSGPVSQKQRLERYSLSRCVGSALAQPDRTWELSVSGDWGEDPPTPVRLGRDFLFAARDGRLYRWGEEPSEPPEVLWPNPHNARLWARPVPLGAREVGFVADAGPAGFSLVRIREGLEGKAAMRRVSPLPLLTNSRARALVALGGVLYLVVQPAGEAIQLYSMDLELEEAQAQRLCTLSGTQEAEVQGLQLLSWEGELRPLLDYSPTPQSLHREFHVVHPGTAQVQKLEWSPNRGSQARVLWEVGRSWRVELTRGRMQVLS